MSELRPGVCLCCNSPVAFSIREWSEKASPAVLCSPCLRMVHVGLISWRELRILYIIRSQIGWIFQELAIMKARMMSLCEAQEDLSKSFFES